MNAHLGSGGLAQGQQSLNQRQQLLESDGIADHAFIASSSSEDAVVNQSAELEASSEEAVAIPISQDPFGHESNPPLPFAPSLSIESLGQNHRGGQGAYEGREYYYNTRALYPTVSPRPRLQLESLGNSSTATQNSQATSSASQQPHATTGAGQQRRPFGVRGRIGLPVRVDGRPAEDSTGLNQLPAVEARGLNPQSEQGRATYGPSRGRLHTSIGPHRPKIPGGFQSQQGLILGGSNLQGIRGRNQANRANCAGGRNARPTAPSTRVDSRGSPVRTGEVNQAGNRGSTTQRGREPVYFHPLGPPQWNWGRELANAGKENVAPGEGEVGRLRPMGPSHSSSQHGGRGALQAEQTATQCLDPQSEGEIAGRESLESETSRIVNLSDDEGSVITRSAETQILSPSPLSAMRAAQLANIAGMVDQAEAGTSERAQQPEENAPEMQHEQQTLGAVESSATGLEDAGSNGTGIGSPQAGVLDAKHGELTDDKSDNDGTQEGNSTVIHHPQPMSHMDDSTPGGQRGPDSEVQVVQSIEAPQVGSPEEVSTLKSRLKKRFLRFKDKVRGIRLLPKKS